MKLLWTGIKSIISIKISNVSVINKLKDTNGNLITDQQLWQIFLINFFVNVADVVTKNIPRSPKSLLNYLKIRIHPLSSYLLLPHMKYQI